jgi:D-3-phosphoglycerate dehydrogenase
MKAFCLNKISQLALDGLKAPDCVTENENEADAILVRSYQMADYVLPKSVVAVARAGAGVNSIPIEKYAGDGVVVFNTPGANANAVKELTICGLLLSCRDIIGGNEWVRANTDDEQISKSAEKAKSRFAGNEIKGKRIAVIGLGVIGTMVANAAVELGMKVVGYDPYLSVQNALKLSKKIEYELEIKKAVANADFISIHAPLTEGTKYMFSSTLFASMKDGTVLLNFARDTLVNDDDLLKAMESGKIKKYVSDFANPKVVRLKNTICLPHLGASTDEAEDNCAKMAIDELKEYIENGSIRNSVNYPTLIAGEKSAQYRLCINHLNTPGLIAKISQIISNHGANIVTMQNQSKKEFAYTVLDVENYVNTDDISEIDGVLRVRVI